MHTVIEAVHDLLVHTVDVDGNSDPLLRSFQHSFERSNTRLRTGFTSVGIFPLPLRSISTGKTRYDVVLRGQIMLLQFSAVFLSFLFLFGHTTFSLVFVFSKCFG